MTWHCISLSPHSDRQNVEQNEIMLRAINACLELDGRSLTKPAALPADEPSSPSISNNAEIREVLLSLLGDGSLFRPNVSLTHGYNIGMGPPSPAFRGLCGVRGH